MLQNNYCSRIIILQNYNSLIHFYSPNSIQCEENISLNIPNDASYQSSFVISVIDKQGYCQHVFVFDHTLHKPFWYTNVFQWTLSFPQLLWQLRHYIFFAYFVRLWFVLSGVYFLSFVLYHCCLVSGLPLYSKKYIFIWHIISLLFTFLIKQGLYKTYSVIGPIYPNDKYQLSNKKTEH